MSRTLSFVLFVAITACAPPSDVPLEDPAQPLFSPDQRSLILDVPSILLSNRNNDLVVRGFTGSATANLVASLAPLGGAPACPPPLLGDCLDIPDPAVLLGSARARQGSATISLRPPASVAGLEAHLQAVSFTNGAFAATEPTTIRVVRPEDDEDGDTLSNEDEVALGTDALVADTDGDTLIDGVELLFGTDPTLADTDGDGANDGAEIAAGTDPLVDESTFCDPLADQDGDGLDDCREFVLGTARHLVDTDGDGFSDFEEVVVNGFSPTTNNFRFNPRIADTPRIEVTITSAPSIALLFEQSTSVGESFEVERSQESSQSVAVGRESATSHAVEFSVTTGVSVTAGVSASFPGFGASAETTVSFETSQSTTQETSLAFSREQTEENSQGLSEARAIESNEGINIVGGVIAVTVDVQNTGDIAYTLTDLALSSSMSTPGAQNILSPVANLNFDTTFNQFPEFTYAPGDTQGPFVFLNDGLDVGTVEALLEDASNLHLQVAAYELTDGDGRSFTHDTTAIFAKNATVVVDYEGDNTLLDSERHQVATNTDPVALSITGQDAMTDILRMDYELDADGKLVRVRDVFNDVDRNGFWYVMHHRDDGLSETVELFGPDDAYDFRTIALRASDSLHMIYVEDIDRDGLGRRQEAAYGTDIDLEDTDGDGLTDGEEVLDFKTDPTSADTDGDFRSDADELADGTDPLVFDPPPPGDNDVDGCPDDADLDDFGFDDADGDGVPDGCDVCPDLFEDDANADGILDCLADPCSASEDYLWVAGGGKIARYNPDNGAFHVVTTTPRFLFDMAFGTDGRLWAVDSSGRLFHVDLPSGTQTQIFDIPGNLTPNGFFIDKAGAALMSTDSEIWSIDLTTEEATLIIADNNSSLRSAGDLSSVGGRLFQSLSNFSNRGALAEIDFPFGTVTEVMDLPAETFSITSPDGERLFGIDQDRVLELDVDAGSFVAVGTIDGMGDGAAAASPAESCTYARSAPIFITSDQYRGNFGGLAAADDICQDEADAVGLVGTYKAWLSDSETSVLDRLTIRGSYARIDGQVVADGFDALAGVLHENLDLDAFGNPSPRGSASGVPVWTNTLATGESNSTDLTRTCNDWTDGTSGSGFTGNFGRARLRFFGDWTEFSRQPCFFEAALYCVEQ